MPTTPRLLEAVPKPDYTVHLRFEDGTEADVDLGYLAYLDGVFEPLRDAEYFRQLRIYSEGQTIFWPRHPGAPEESRRRTSRLFKPTSRRRPSTLTPAVALTQWPESASHRLPPRYRWAMPRDPLPIRFLVDGRPVAGESLYLDAGANVLVLTSCSAKLGIELRSAYLAGEGRDELLVAESAVIGAGPAELCTRRLESAPEAHSNERRRLLYDHLSASRISPPSAEHALAFDGVDAAAVQLDPLSPTSA